jgi:DNA polymerase-3 subunit gamma/tau
VLSRCQRFDFRRIPATEIAGHLRHIVEEEGFQAEDEALMAIARSAQGCMRDAISLLDQMFSVGDNMVTLHQVQQALGAVGTQLVNDLVDALAAREIPQGLRLVQQLVLDGASLTEFTHQVVEHLRGIMVLQMAHDPELLNELPDELVRQMQAQAQRMTLPVTITAVKRFSEAINELKSSYQPQLPLELAFIEAVNGVMVAPAAAMVAATMPVTAQATAPVAASSKPAPVQSNGKPTAASSTTHSVAQPATTPAEAEPPPLDHTAVKKLRDQWKQLQAQIKVDLGLKVLAAFNCVRDIAVSDQGVAFAFGNNSFAKEMLSQSENHSRIVTILSDFLGRPIQLECQMGDQAKLSRRISTHDLADGNTTDPLVEYAVNNLGAKVVDDEE